MIHPTAVIHPQAQVHPTATVGPYAVIDAQVVLGPECWIGPHVHLTGVTVIGAGNRFHAGCVIGDAPQDLKYQEQPTRLRIGDRNVFREHTTIHRSNKIEEETVIGSHNFFMAHSHVAENPFHAECLRLLRKLREAPERQLPHSVLLKRMKIEAKTFVELISTLEQQGDLATVIQSTFGRPQRVYRLAGAELPGERI